MNYSQNNHMDMGAYRVALRALLDATVTLKIHWTQVFIDINHMYKYDQNPITRSWFIVKTHFSIIGPWPLTLTLGQLFCLININLTCKYHQDWTIYSCFIAKTITRTQMLIELHSNSTGRDCRDPTFLNTTTYLHWSYV